MEFRLVDSNDQTLERLARRTEISESMTSNHTDKSFRGVVEGNQFRLISAAIGRGAFCVMTGAIGADGGYVEVEINKIFRYLLGIFYAFPLIGLIGVMMKESEEFPPIMILVAIGQLLIIRYAFIGLAFTLLSRDSLNRLRDVLDLEWTTGRP